MLKPRKAPRSGGRETKVVLAVKKKERKGKAGYLSLIGFSKKQTLSSGCRMFTRGCTSDQHPGKGGEEHSMGQRENSNATEVQRNTWPVPWPALE